MPAENTFRKPEAMTRPIYALSLKQPWAALLVTGLKTIEIRSWMTTVRGRVMIHAAKIPDPRPEAWAHVPDEWRVLATTEGGIVGEAKLMSLTQYKTAKKFTMEASRHLNAPAWYGGPKTYGFVFRDAKVLPFEPCKGNVRFFRVDEAK